MKGNQINREVLSNLPIKDLNKPIRDYVLKDLDFVKLKNLKNFINLNIED
jgi:hypothetical protein